MRFKLITLSLLVTSVLGVACSGSDSSNDDVLHLRDADISESDYRIHVIGMFAAIPASKDYACGLARLSQEEFVRGLTQDPGQSRTPMKNETPVPGQHSDKRSEERVYAIIKELCA